MATAPVTVCLNVTGQESIICMPCRDNKTYAVESTVVSPDFARPGAPDGGDKERRDPMPRGMVEARTGQIPRRPLDKETACGGRY